MPKSTGWRKSGRRSARAATFARSPQGVQVGRVSRALDFPHKFRVRGQERPGAPVAFRALGDLSPPGAVHHDGMAPAPTVGSDHDRSVGCKHRPYRVGADARRIDEQDHRARPVAAAKANRREEPMPRSGSGLTTT